MAANSFGTFQNSGGYTNKDGLRDLLVITVFLIIVIGIQMVLIPFVSNFGSGGGAVVMSNLQKYWTYVPMAIVGSIFFAIKLTRYLTKGKYKWLDVTIFDPENSLIGRSGAVKFFSKKVGVFPTFMLFFLLFVAISGAISIAGAVAKSSNYPNTAIPDVAFIEQSSWKTPAELALSVYPASPAETMSLQFYLMVLRMIFYAIYFAATKAKNVNIALLIILDLIILPAAGGAYWLEFHKLRYGESETAQVSVFTFGVMSSFFITITHTYFTGQIYHDINNFVQKYVQIFASELAIIPLVAAEILIIFLFVTLLIWTTRRPNKRPDPQGVY